MGDLSAHFSKHEFVCHHCGELPKAGIAPTLIQGLEELRTSVGAAIYLTCGYRCPEHNKAVGGKPYSQHLYGKAADIKVIGVSLLKLLEEAEKVTLFHGLGLYPNNGFLHVDVRMALARWGKVGVEYVSFSKAREVLESV